MKHHPPPLSIELEIAILSAVCAVVILLAGVTAAALITILGAS